MFENWANETSVVALEKVCDKRGIFFYFIFNVDFLKYTLLVIHLDEDILKVGRNA